MTYPYQFYLSLRTLALFSSRPSYAMTLRSKHCCVIVLFRNWISSNVTHLIQSLQLSRQPLNLRTFWSMVLRVLAKLSCIRLYVTTSAPKDALFYALLPQVLQQYYCLVAVRHIPVLRSQSTVMIRPPVIFQYSLIRPSWFAVRLLSSGMRYLCRRRATLLQSIQHYAISARMIICLVVYQWLWGETLHRLYRWFLRVIVLHRLMLAFAVPGSGQNFRYLNSTGVCGLVLGLTIRNSRVGLSVYPINHLYTGWYNYHQKSQICTRIHDFSRNQYFQLLTLHNPRWYRIPFKVERSYLHGLIQQRS
jgi:hypothetical protein